MNYYTIQPSRNISEYVRSFWVLEGEVSAGQPYIHRCMADGYTELLFHYKGKFDRLNSKNEQENCFISGIQGQSHQFKRFIVNKDFGMFGVYLYPYAIRQLFSIPTSELTNQMTKLEDLFGNELKGLEEKIMLAEDNLQRVKIVSTFLESKIARSKNMQPGVIKTVHYILQTKGTVNVEALAKQNFLSTRQFERNFKEFSGFSPKLFSRVIRFQSALSQYHNKEKSLTEIAYECGYYDQSHFIHDFKEFSGYHPNYYFSGKAEGIALLNA